MIKSRLELVVWLIEKLGIDEKAKEYWKEEVVEYENPIEELHELEDAQDKIYVWKLKDDARKKQDVSFGKRIDRFYEEKQGRKSDALHLTVDEVDDIKRITPEEYREMIPQWVKEA